MSAPNIIDLDNPPAAAELRPKTASPRRLAANRANARKSTGPKSPQGKQTAKFNALQHGLTARHVCLPGESRDDYDERRRQYIHLFKPTNILELELVDALAAALWAKQRYTRIETHNIEDQVYRSRLDFDANYDEITTDGEAALAFRVLADESNALQLLERYGARATRDVRAAMQLLQEAIRMRPTPPAPPAPVVLEPQPEIAELRNEANPGIEHSEPAPEAAFVPRTAQPISRKCNCKPKLNTNTETGRQCGAGLHPAAGFATRQDKVMTANTSNTNSYDT